MERGSESGGQGSDGVATERVIKEVRGQGMLWLNH